MRVAGIFTSKDINIEALNLAPAPARRGISRLTLTAEVEPHLRRRNVSQLKRLINVLRVVDRSVPAGADAYSDSAASEPAGTPAC